MLKIGVKIDADKATREFEDARRDIRTRVKDALAEVGRLEALPAARAVAWSFAKGLLTVRSTQNFAYVTTRGDRKLGRAVGLLEYGGTVRTPIEPRQKEALAFGGLVRARVDSPRHYRGSLRMTQAVHSRRSAIDKRILREVLKAFREFDTSGG